MSDGYDYENLHTPVICPYDRLLFDRLLFLPSASFC